MPTAGLLNIIGAPHLAEASTYLPNYTGARESEAVKRHHSSPEVAVALKSLAEIGYPPVVSRRIHSESACRREVSQKHCAHVRTRGCASLPTQVGGYWSSGLPYLDATIKGTKKPWEAGLQLPLLMLNISDLQVCGLCAQPPQHSSMQRGLLAAAPWLVPGLTCRVPPLHACQAAVSALPEEAWTYAYQAQHSAVMAGREGNQNAFKPGACARCMLAPRPRRASTHSTEQPTAMHVYRAARLAGVEGIVLLFSANDGSGPVYKFPFYDYFAPVLEPLLEEVRVRTACSS